MVKIFLRVFLVTLGLILSIFLSIHFFASLAMGPPPLMKHETHQALLALLEGQLRDADSQQVAALADEVLKPHINYQILPVDHPKVPKQMKGHFFPQSELVSLPNDFDTVFY